MKNLLTRFLRLLRAGSLSPRYDRKAFLYEATDLADLELRQKEQAYSMLEMNLRY